MKNYKKAPDKEVGNLTEAARELGRKGGNKTLKKYGKRQMKEWGKKGGRPKQIT